MMKVEVINEFPDDNSGVFIIRINDDGKITKIASFVDEADAQIYSDGMMGLVNFYLELDEKAPTK